MSDREPQTTSALAQAAAVPIEPPPPVTFAKFLESAPPGQIRTVEDVRQRKYYSNGNIYYVIATPELFLHCNSDVCNGPRYFRFSGSEIPVESGRSVKQVFLSFVCSNCQSAVKTFALRIAFPKDDSDPGRCLKFGEDPDFGPPTPNRLLRLFGKDSKIFLKGRQCENHDLGIGAFGYYRRVVENHKDQIFDAIIKVTSMIASDLVPTLEAAKKEHQFLKAIDMVKDGPQGLLINGQNPLTLLLSALSEGLHGRTDEERLQAAHDVRIVLTGFGRTS
jgi:hypothetical protein